MVLPKGASARPLSPHLQIFRPMLSTALSILHRITGGALYFGTILLVVWLIAAASGPSAFATVQGVYGSLIGQLVLFLYTWTLINHAFGGVRHLIWDTGHGFEATTRELLYKVSVVGSIGLTLLIWAAVYAMRGSAG